MDNKAMRFLFLFLFFYFYFFLCIYLFILNFFMYTDLMTKPLLVPPNGFIKTIWELLFPWNFVKWSSFINSTNIMYCQQTFCWNWHFVWKVGSSALILNKLLKTKWLDIQLDALYYCFSAQKQHYSPKPQIFCLCQWFFLSSFVAHCPHATKGEITQKMIIALT